jgi:hypothetical protein
VKSTRLHDLRIKQEQKGKNITFQSLSVLLVLITAAYVAALAFSWNTKVLPADSDVSTTTIDNITLHQSPPRLLGDKSNEITPPQTPQTSQATER